MLIDKRRQTLRHCGDGLGRNLPVARNAIPADVGPRQQQHAEQRHGSGRHAAVRHRGGERQFGLAVRRVRIGPEAPRQVGCVQA